MSGSLHTLRGVLSDGEVRHLVIDDGRFRHGMVVREFTTWPNKDTSTAAPNDYNATLGLQHDMNPLMDASDNRQIAWSFFDNSMGLVDIMDPQHVIVRDLYVQAHSGASMKINYLIILECVDLSPEEGVLALIKERSQDDTR